MNELKTEIPAELPADTEMVHPELAAIEVDGSERSDVLMKGALAAGAIFGLGAISPFVRNAMAANGNKGDIEILNYALTLEYLESAFYAEALKKAGLSGDLKQLVTTISTDEDAHVKAISQTIKDLGGKPVKAPKVEFPYSDTAGFTALAETIENVGVSAYNGAAPMISSKDVLEAAGSIVQVEARHAAAIALQNGNEPAPDAFDKPMTQAQVLKAVQPFLVS
ncbi:MAG TPA: ferritin-like domain-containing protein [Solirubrobacterales bacterium]|nr:ferritin-like domain-containing protein [Solirubrobacterales bacterium]HNC94409.1 ferritin-like domain-containing protein [Solirubrobacterales bacterium]